jgi:hypothetical protein
VTTKKARRPRGKSAENVKPTDLDPSTRGNEGGRDRREESRDSEDDPNARPRDRDDGPR